VVQCSFMVEWNDWVDWEEHEWLYKDECVHGDHDERVVYIPHSSQLWPR